jgi:hypothetical protein
MKNVDDGGPAFACTGHSPDFGGVFQAGMTLRDYFAAKAMAAYVAQTIIDMNSEDVDRERLDEETIAVWAYELADAMLAEREERA